VHLSNSLAWLGRRAQTKDEPLTFILYPEGTLVSKDTRPISKKYADKMGIPDMTNMLLPKSTGLHYSLRSLAPKVSDLQMIDITTAYPGIPPLGYGQSYYTLRSIFCDRVPPPVVHMHIRRFSVSKDLPIGDIKSAHPDNGNNNQEIEIPDAEKETFDLWLRSLWREKDKSMTKFLNTGSFVDDKSSVLEIPIKLRHNREILDAFCFFVPAFFGWLISKLG